MKLFYLAVFAFLVFSCASYKTQISSDRSFTFKGNKIFLEVTDIKEQDISSSSGGRIIYNTAYDFFIAKGFEITDKQRSADLKVRFIPIIESKNVYVPGHSYSIPLYGNSANTTTTTIKDAYGQKIGSLETKSNDNPFVPTGYTTGYQEGYTSAVQDRWLLVQIGEFQRGKFPKVISEGQVWPEQRNQSFFENQSSMKIAIAKLLNESIFGGNEKPPVRTDNLDQACWPRLGLTYDEKAELTKGARIASFSPGSNAEKAGLKIGDIIYTISGDAQPSTSSYTYSEGQELLVIGERRKKPFKTKIKTAIICFDE